MRAPSQKGGGPPPQPPINSAPAPLHLPSSFTSSPLSASSMPSLYILRVCIPRIIAVCASIFDRRFIFLRRDWSRRGNGSTNEKTRFPREFFDSGFSHSETRRATCVEGFLCFGGPFFSSILRFSIVSSPFSRRFLAVFSTFSFRFLAVFSPVGVMISHC